jgi:hypothetical protein
VQPRVVRCLLLVLMASFALVGPVGSDGEVRSPAQPRTTFLKDSFDDARVGLLPRFAVLPGALEQGYVASPL